jgi:hypothetical protein
LAAVDQQVVYIEYGPHEFLATYSAVSPKIKGMGIFRIVSVVGNFVHPSKSLPDLANATRIRLEPIWRAFCEVCVRSGTAKFFIGQWERIKSLDRVAASNIQQIAPLFLETASRHPADDVIDYAFESNGGVPICRQPWYYRASVFDFDGKPHRFREGRTYRNHAVVRQQTG